MSNTEETRMLTLEESLARLVGGRITATTVNPLEDWDAPGEGGSGWPSIEVTMPNGDVFPLEVSRDPEGNGPGYLFGLIEVETVASSLHG
jgi:hypothetical protein